MTLSELKLILKSLKTISFKLPNGQFVPKHAHITEIGRISKHFIDCGGTERKETLINFQLWAANDYNHRLHSEKLLQIIDLSEKALKLPNLDIEVSYQSDTIGHFGLDFDGQYFLLTNTYTDCLAKDKCGISEDKPPMVLENKCTPGSGCC
ncbi:DUF6428 family protein [Bizionia sediminis]|uniref:DUF6428 family protein n=1 Tax=Bizionia sediminis TaxID=1737064 RepID=A0ABW5KVY9_9FLAO